MLVKHVDFYPLRYRGVSADDPDYDALGLPPNTGIYTIVGGAAGNYVHRLVDVRGRTIIEFTEAFDTDEATTAENMAANIDAAAQVQDSRASRYIHGASYPGSGDAFYVHYRLGAEFLVEHDVPAGSVTQAPGDRWPQAVAINPDTRAGGYPNTTMWEFKVKAVDASGNFLPNTGTYTYQVLQGSAYQIPPSKTVLWDNSTRGTSTGNVGDTHRVEVDGADEITVLLTGLAGIHANADQLIIDAHPVVV